jgi:hypothetical protein
LSGRVGTLDEAHERFSEELKEEPRASALADYYLRSFPYVDEGTRKEGTKAGGKRKLRRKGEIKPLPGNQRIDTDIKIRAIVGMRYQNIPDRDIEDNLGISRKYVNELECKYPAAFDAAEADCVALVMRDYYRNVQMIRGAAGYAGKLAIETMVELMSDKTMNEVVRVRAAKYVLDLLDVGGGPRNGGAAAVVDAVTDTVKTVYDMAREDRSSTIVAVDAEVIEDGGPDGV